MSIEKTHISGSIQAVIKKKKKKDTATIHKGTPRNASETV